MRSWTSDPRTTSTTGLPPTPEAKPGTQALLGVAFLPLLAVLRHVPKRCVAMVRRRMFFVIRPVPRRFPVPRSGACGPMTGETTVLPWYPCDVEDTGKQRPIDGDLHRPYPLRESLPCFASRAHRTINLDFGAPPRLREGPRNETQFVGQTIPRGGRRVRRG